MDSSLSVKSGADGVAEVSGAGSSRRSPCLGLLETSVWLLTNLLELGVPGWDTSRYTSNVDSGLSLEERDIDIDISVVFRRY